LFIETNTPFDVNYTNFTCVCSFSVVAFVLTIRCCAAECQIERIVNETYSLEAVQSAALRVLHATTKFASFIKDQLEIIYLLVNKVSLQHMAPTAAGKSLPVFLLPMVLHELCVPPTQPILFVVPLRAIILSHTTKLNSIMDNWNKQSDFKVRLHLRNPVLS